MSDDLIYLRDREIENLRNIIKQRDVENNRLKELEMKLREIIFIQNERIMKLHKEEV